MDNLTLGSLFDGSGGFPLGGILAGITPLWAAEIEPFPIRVTTKRLPQVQHYGDVSALSGSELPPVDIITFGSPCQDMSIAGKRSGLDGSRSGLFHEAIRIVKEMRCATNGEKPRFIVWENVPGAFSSNQGADFRAVIEEICKVKDDSISVPQAEKWVNAGEVLGEGFSIAWRVFDAQYWGVPQRRKRIYLVADFADQCAGKILFESEGVSGYSAEGFRAWQGAATGAEDSFGAAERICLNDQGGNRIDITSEITCTLRAEAHHPPCILEAAGFCTEHSAKARNIGYEEEKAPTLRAGVVPATVYENHSQDTRYTEPDGVAPTVSATYGMGGNNQPLVVSAPMAFGVCSKDSNSMRSDNPNSGFYKAETSRTLDGNGGNPTCNQGGIAVVENVANFDVRLTSEGTRNARNNIYPTDVARTIDTGGNSPDSNQGGVAVVAIQGSMIGRSDENGPQGCGYGEDVSFTLNTADRHAVAYGIDRSAFNQGKNASFDFAVEPEKQPTMVAKGPGAVAVPTYSLTTGSFMQYNEELSPTLAARDYKDPPVVNDADEIKYIVRRLTPTECARLQGFPDWWCADLGTANPSEEEIEFWAEVFETHRKIVGTSTKPKTRNQIIKWLAAPHSDSAEYKMWGNGVALPCVYFVLSGIVCYAHKTVS